MNIPSHLPPLDGSIRVVPGFIDFHAEHNPQRAWAVYPSDAPDGVSSISFSEFSKATHRVAHYIRPGRQGEERETVGVLIHCDAILYIAVITGFMRAGVVPFPISPRNSPQAVAHLLKQTNAKRLITQPAFAPLVDAVRTELSAQGFQFTSENLISLDTAFPTIRSGTSESLLVEGPYPQPKVEPGIDDVMLYIHSSGSTGLPKPIPQTSKLQLQWATCHLLVETRKRGVQWASMALPTFHMMGIFMQVMHPLVSGQAVALYPPQAPGPPVMPNPENALEVCRRTKSAAMPCVPSFIEVWAQSEETVKYLSTMTKLCFAGGPLSAKSGNKLVAAGVPLYSMYGSSECGAISQGFDIDDSQGPDAPVKTSADWDWFQFNKTVKPRFVPQGDGTFELHMLTCETHQPALENLQDVRGYATSDLFEPHPTKEGLWRIVGRTDDVIVLGTGEKIVPIPQEGHLVSNSIITGAVMFGRGRTQAGVLIEPHPAHAIDPSDEQAVVAFRQKIWPIVEEANKIAPAFGRIFKEMIIVTEPGKPLPRAAKATVMRKQALALYNNAIESLYKAVDDSSTTEGIAPPQSWRQDDIETWLLRHAAALNDGRELSPTIDLFSQGFDSLTATFARNRIVAALRSSPDKAVQATASQISQNFIFDHPSIQELSAAIESLINGGGSVQKNPVDAIHDFIMKYSADLPHFNRAEGSLGDRTVVLLTGSTGNIGSHILSSLLDNESISKVYTLDRANADIPAKRRQISAFEDRGLPTDLLSSSKLTAITGDLNSEYFGLDKSVFEEIRDNVTHLVHNAWKVDFNLSLASFESQIAGTRKLVDFCALTAHPTKLFFTSSISVAAGWPVASGPVPEEPISDAKVAIASGYSASKYVVEQLLARAYEHGLDATSLRIGQVCGSAATGAWNTTDWVPILVKSSMALGCLPSLNETVDWIPMDVVASTVNDLILSTDKPAQLFNVVHPQPTSWDGVFTSVNTELTTQLPLVPYAQWLDKLSALASDASLEQIKEVPAIKLLDFFRLLVASQERSSGPLTFSTDKVQHQSKTIHQLNPIGRTHAQKWVKYWKSKGLFV